ncbi:hypothetical protein B0T22DRAFT_526805 [Podospora appendiculata]|uniref:proline--tRNA ligase n=1 Tax=Podospora appendiculata TaxID=314037 RepID=A0AAE0XKX6_9PEZI|nr:hypothetical protein B0T22DRAFT_526805 [Podospora appendiculata]
MHPQAVHRLSRVWVPSGGGIAASGLEDGHAKLIRAGFLRQSHAGIFHMLPLGRRVQDKIERLVARHMEHALAASRVALSSISAESLWEKSGRLPNVSSELFRFSDRKGVPYLLSPTHEEEITSLVARTVKSYKELPLRLYQITPKYRDEFRPRHGLLRGREFIMKDLYTFDTTVHSALETYEEVRVAYTNIFLDMRLPVLAAKASSGDMGGDLSHEYLLPTALGEDRVVSCGSCDYVVNEEVAEAAPHNEVSLDTDFAVWRGISKDRSTLINAWYPAKTNSPTTGSVREYTGQDINLSAVKCLKPDLDAGVEDALPIWAAALEGPDRRATALVNIVDGRLPPSFSEKLRVASGRLGASLWPEELDPPQPTLPISIHGEGREEINNTNLLRIRTGDRCPRCSAGVLKVEKAIELGHTFHLGTRYSEPLGAMISLPANTSPGTSKVESGRHGSDTPQTVPIQMGCHGIGISRLIGAIAEHRADKKGLNWPISIAPYSCVVIPAREADKADALQVYQQINGAVKTAGEPLDAVLDDRNKSLPWKLNDADLVGYPIIVLLGRDWPSSRRVEVQCRAVGMKDVIHVDDLPPLIQQLHNTL